MMSELSSIAASLRDLAVKLDAIPAPGPVAPRRNYLCFPSVDTAVKYPCFAPLTFAVAGEWCDVPKPRSQKDKDTSSLVHVPVGNMAAYASRVREGGIINGMPRVAGAPVVLDFESPGMDVETGVPIAAAYVKEFRAAYPDCKIGINLSPTAFTAIDHYGWDKLTPAEVKSLETSLAKTAPLIDQADHLVFVAYLLAPEWLERDLVGYRGHMAWLRKRFPGKAMIVVINPYWMASRTAEWREGDPGYVHRTDQVKLNPATARRIYDLAAEFGDVAIWNPDAAACIEVFGELARHGGR